MKKAISNFFIIIYFIIAIIITVLLLSYNDHKVTEIGDYTFVISTDEELEDVSAKGDLMLVKKSKNKEIAIGDKVFFYTVEDNQSIITAAEITSKDQSDARMVSYTVTGDYKLSEKNIIGKVDGCTRIPVLGTVLNILESRFAFLFLVVFPSFIAFLYQGYKVIMEIKYGEFEDLK